MNEQIFDSLNNILRQKKEIRLLNIYKGVPISYDAVLLGVDQQFVHIQCNKYQIACVFLERGTFIQAEDISGTLRGQLYKMDLSRNEILLTNIIRVNGGIGQRNQVRVEPDSPIWVSIKLKNSVSEVMAKVSDLSLGGLGIHLERYYFHPQLFRVGTELTLKFELPQIYQNVSSNQDSNRDESFSLANRFNRDQIRGINTAGIGSSRDPQRGRPVDAPGAQVRVVCSGRIIHYRPELHNDRFRIGIRLQDNEGNRQLISQFITQRQSNLIREFRLVYDGLVQNQTGRDS